MSINKLTIIIYDLHNCHMSKEFPGNLNHINELITIPMHILQFVLVILQGNFIVQGSELDILDSMNAYTHTDTYKVSKLYSSYGCTYLEAQINVRWYALDMCTSSVSL